ncbi:MAG: glycosyltransferase family 39 protein [Anaerolineaceae bacterium]|nr:glycosyltransferase family 39 protein [Anaerolineaceae bacterium]
MPLFTDNPFLAVFYALLSLPFFNSPYWMILACGLGRFIMFAFLWLAVYLIARQLQEEHNPTILVGMMFVSSIGLDLLPNPSDGMFTILSAFTLWKLIAFYKQDQVKDLLCSSVFLGLAALSRNDGIVLFLIYLVLVIAVIISGKRKWKSVLYAILPFIVMVGGYLLIGGLVTGNFSMGISARSYLAFEQGHELAYEGGGIHSPTINAMLDAQEVYGTAEENNLSVFRAIMGNPGAYFKRLKIILTKLPFQFLEVYNKKLTALFLLFMFRGIYEMFRKKKFIELGLIILWAAYLLTYLLTFVREGYLRTVFFIIFILASIGLSAITNNLHKKSEKVFILGSLILLIISGLFFNKLAIYYGASLFLISFIAILMIRKRFVNLPKVNEYSLVLLLLAGIILRGNYPSPRMWTLGDQGDEMAAIYMMENLEKGTSVLAGSPGVPWLAKMNFLSLNSTDVPAMESKAVFHEWMQNEGISAVYVDYSISRDAPYYWDLIQELENDGLDLVFSANQGSNRVYILDESWNGK